VSDHDDPQALSKIAEQAGFNLSDVAFVSGLDESTISRLWTDPGWLDRITGGSLQKLIASVPGVADYVTAHSLAVRRARLIRELADEGLIVNEVSLKACTRDGVPEPFIGNALEAALHTMRGDAPKMVSYLARFWGRDQDRVLERLYTKQKAKAMLENPEALLTASTELAPKLVRKAYSFHSILAHAALAHHVGRATGRAEPVFSPQTDDRRGAFTHRSSVMGLLIEQNDCDLAEKYEQMVADSPVLTVIEDWSFPTYMRDARPNSDFALPSSILLRNTADEVIREVNEYSDAYVHYLLSTYLPLALKRDPTFGLSIRRVASAIGHRFEVTSDRDVRKVCEKTLRDLNGELSD
jgi:hypothetical protein